MKAIARRLESLERAAPRAINYRIATDDPNEAARQYRQMLDGPRVVCRDAHRIGPQEARRVYREVMG